MKIQLGKLNEQLEAEKKELAILLEKRSKEVDRLNGKLQYIVQIHKVIICLDEFYFFLQLQ